MIAPEGVVPTMQVILFPYTESTMLVLFSF